MTAHRNSQKRTNWYEMTEGGEMACITRKQVYGIDASLGTRTDEKIDGGCEHIILAIAHVLRPKSDRAKGLYKEKISRIVQEAKPGPPMKTIHRKITETRKRTKADGTVEEVTRVIEEDVPADMWREQQQKRQKKAEDPENALTLKKQAIDSRLDLAA